MLTVYGTVQWAGVLLVHTGVVDPATPVPGEVVYWRLLLWEPWFVVWGLLLGSAAWPDATVVRRADRSTAPETDHA
jgi:hypothetical protein